MVSTTYKQYGIHKKTPQPKLAISPDYSGFNRRRPHL